MLTVVEARVAELRENPRNPRRIRPERLEQLQRTMVAQRAMLDARPLIVLMDGTVIAGNQRLAAARALGWETIPAVFVELDEVEAAMWMFVDNRAFGEDDEDLTAELLAEVAARGGDLDLTGYERAETERLLRGLAYRDRDPDELPTLPEQEKPDSVAGMVYEEGRHRIMCGDATDPGCVETLLAGAEPTLMVTDPPYGVSLDNGWRDRVGLGSRAGAVVDGRRRTKQEGHVTTVIACDDRADWSAAYELVPSIQVAYVWHASRHACLVQAGLERVGFELRQQIIWDKGLFALSRANYHWRHEPCAYAVRSDTPVRWLGPRNQSTVWEASSPKMVMSPHGGSEDRRVDHPTQKPVVLFQRPIENHLEPGEIVYDPFAGSGTAVIAAELTGRVAYVMELDPRCCDLIRARLREFSDGR